MGVIRGSNVGKMRLLLVILLATLGLLLAKPSQAGYHPHQPLSSEMIEFEEEEPEQGMKLKRRPIGAALKQGKPFIDEVALKAVDTPFWKALNDILATNVPAAREVRTAPEDYMILRKIRSGSNGGGHWLRGLCAETEDDGECQKQAFASFNSFYKKAFGKKRAGPPGSTSQGDYWQRFLNPPFMYQV